MHRRLMALLLVLGVASVAALGTWYGTTRIDLSDSPNDVDHVTLYQNGLAAISLVRPYDAPGGETWLTFQLPTTTVFDSILVRGDGIVVKELRSSLSQSPVLHPGDQLIVHVRDGPRIEGSLLEQSGDQLLIATKDSSALVRMSDIATVEVKGRAVDPAEAGTTTVSILVTADAGPRTVKLSYLAQGAGWSPNHIFDPTTGAFTFFATLTGMQDWDNVTLDLIAGNPNMVYTPAPRAMTPSSPTFDYAGLGGSGPAYGDGFTPSSSLGDLHKYHFKGTVTLRQGELVRLPVATGTVQVLRHFYEANAQPHERAWTGLPEKYQFRNTLAEPIPAGPVRIYLGGEWVGADNVQAVGISEIANITAAFSGDVKARTVVDSVVRGEPFNSGEYGRRIRHVTTVYDVQVRNLRTGADAAIDVRATFEPGTWRIIGVDAIPPESLREGTTLVWNENAGSGEVLHHRITVQHDEDV